jgi:membrane protein
MPPTTTITERGAERLPGPLADVVESAGRHHTMTLAAGLAFFGLLSIAPAIGLGFALVRILVSPEAADALVELLRDSGSEFLGLVDLLEQMEDRAPRYAGIALLVLLWPASTLASGWTRGLDAVMETDSAGGVRGLRGRVAGLVPGAVLVGGLLVLVGAVTIGTALVGADGVLLLVLLPIGALAFVFLLNLLIYRWLPSETRPWRSLWPGAAWATAGVVLSTAGLALALAFGQRLTDSYPPALTTAIVLGLWIYGANTALLLGAEYNESRRAR